MRDVKELSLKFDGGILIVETPCFLYFLELCLSKMELQKQAFFQTKATSKKQGVSSI